MSAKDRSSGPAAQRSRGSERSVQERRQVPKKGTKKRKISAEEARSAHDTTDILVTYNIWDGEGRYQYSILNNRVVAERLAKKLNGEVTVVTREYRRRPS